MDRVLIAQRRSAVPRRIAAFGSERGPDRTGSARFLVLWVGAASLAGQVSWARIVSAVVGGTFAATSITLSAAMAGIAAGAGLAGAILGRVRARTLLAGSLLGCGVALAILPWALLQIGALEGFPGLRILLAATLLALGHLPFGAVLPCVLSWRGDRLASGGADLYALGALGAVGGALGMGLVLAALSALDHIGIVLGAVTALCGGLVLKGRDADPGPARRMMTRTEEKALRYRPWILAVGLGLLGLTTESLWLRSLAFSWESDPIVYALVTAAHVAGLSLGSFAAGRAGRRRPSGRAGIAAGLILSCLSLAVTAAFACDASRASTPGERLLTACLLVGAPACFSGATLMILVAGVGGAGDAGRSWGFLTAANAAGSAAAPLILWAAGPWLPWPPRMLLLAACGYAALGGLVVPGRLKAIGASVLLTGAVALGGWGRVPGEPPPRDFHADAPPSEARDFEATVFPFVRAGLDSTVAVSRDTRTGMEVLWIGRHSQGTTSAWGRRIQSTLGRLPGEILGRPPRRAMIIGLGTGITAAAVLEGGARAVDVAELSPGVIEANRTVLAAANGALTERRELRVHHADGRTMLADAAEGYDLILADMVFPTVVGAGNLFSREFYDLARRRLTPDGLFVHWLPCFQLSPPDLRAVIAGFREAFPEGGAWIGFLEPRTLILALVGGAVPLPLADAAADRFALGPSDLREWAGSTPPIRDADPRLEHRSRLADGAPPHGVENLRELLDRMRRAQAPERWIAADRRPACERSRRSWLPYGEAGLASGEAQALALYRSALAEGLEDARFSLDTLSYGRELEAARRNAASGNGRAALESLRRAAAYPLFAGGNIDLADALAARGNFAEALAEAEKAVAKSPRSADALIKLALLSCLGRDFARARRAYASAAALRPDRPPVFHEAARWIAAGAVTQ